MTHTHVLSWNKFVETDKLDQIFIPILKWWHIFGNADLIFNLQQMSLSQSLKSNRDLNTEVFYRSLFFFSIYIAFLSISILIQEKTKLKNQGLIIRINLTEIGGISRI